MVGRHMESQMSEARAAIARVKAELNQLLEQVDQPVPAQPPRTNTMLEDPSPRRLRNARVSGALRHSNVRTRYDLRRAHRDELPMARVRRI